MKAKRLAMISEDSTEANSPPNDNSKTFFKPEPRMIGMERRKLKRAADSLFNLLNKPPEIVAPEREKPGTRAKH